MLAAALAFSSPASAADEYQISSVTQDQYGESSDRFAGGGGTPPSTVGSLPFTGLDLALMGAAAVVLVAGGVVVARRTRADQPN